MIHKLIRNNFCISVVAIYIFLSVDCNYKSEITKSIQRDTFEISFYNNVLQELVEDAFYQYYLNYFIDSASSLFDDYYYKKILDSAEYSSRINILREQVLADSTKRCNLYLDTTNFWKPQFTDIASKISDSSNTRFSVKLKSILTPFLGSDKGTSIIDSLNSVQKRYSYIDFKLKACKVKDLSSRKHFINECEIGVIRISKMTLDSSKTKALLYFEFYCGSKCGMGDLISLELIDGVWFINGNLQFWIS